MAKTVTFKGSINTFEGATIPALSYSAEYVELAKGDTIPADEMLSEDDIRNAVNAARKQNARSKAVNQTLTDAGYEKKSAAEKLQDVDVQVATMVKVFVARGMSAADAEAQARTILGL